LIALAAIIEKDNVNYLFYADLESKTVYLINPLENEKQNSFQEIFHENWAKFSKKNLLLKDKWKKSNFKFNSKKKRIVESDIPILMSFEALENKQKQTKIDIESFSTKRSLVLMKIENNGKSM
jgi:hypothetical protein